MNGNLNFIYRANEASTLTGPRFDFSSLLNPAISFKIAHEIEGSFDGLQLQTSTDGGTSWSTVGNFDPAHWYNESNIAALNADRTSDRKHAAPVGRPAEHV